jgi:hypothetical protein
MTFAALIAVATFGVGCGDSLVSKDIDTSGNGSIALTASTSINGSSAAPTLRGNTRDILNVEAKVSGLTTNVGFYLPVNYGLLGPHPVTASGSVDPDGYYYTTADKSGVARATFVSTGGVGSTQVIAKAGNKTAVLQVHFDFATLTILPSVLDMDVQGATDTIYFRGAAPPVEVWSSDPNAITVTKLDETKARVLLHDLPALIAAGTTGVTITAMDDEGQKATATIVAANSCTTGVLTVTPAADVVNGSVISVLLVDSDQLNFSSVSVHVTTTVAGVAAQDVVLSQWLTPGVFQANYTVPAAGVAGTDTISFHYSDQSVGCVPGVVTTTAAY